MAKPAEKRAKLSHSEETNPDSNGADTSKKPDEGGSTLLQDPRSAWLVKSDQNQMVEIVVQDETLRVHRSVLVESSQYFAACLQKPYVESGDVVHFTDIDPKALALYFTVLYNYSSMGVKGIVPGESAPSTHFEPFKSQLTLQELVEVYKLSDRLVSDQVTAWTKNAILDGIFVGHKAMLQDDLSPSTQQEWIEYFVNGYTALDTSQAEMRRLGEHMVEFFAKAVDFKAWIAWTGGKKGLESSPAKSIFVFEVSKCFAMGLDELEGEGDYEREPCDSAPTA